MSISTGAQDAFNDYQRGFGTALAPNWRDLVRGDSKPLPEPLLRGGSPNLGTATIPPERYLSYDFHRQEVEKVWKRTWQVVCREEEIPNIGDHFVYDVAGLSFIVVRTAGKTFKAYYNVCLHRGRKLVDHDGCGATQFRCAYHAWTWSIDGKLAFYPGGWDFPTVTQEGFSLRETLVDTWGGFIFINPDPHAAPLARHLGSMPQHFAAWPLDRRFSLYHVRKTVAANWKVAMEAFLESYHVVQTHPQALSSVAEHATEYDIYDEDTAQFSRLITPTGVPSHHARNGSAQAAIGDVWALLNGLRAEDADKVPPHIHDRATLAAWRREVLGQQTGADYASLPDTCMLDSYQYWLFPNFCPWYGEGLPLSYVFRPDTDSPDSCYMDVWMLIRAPDHGPVPPAPKLVTLKPDEPFEPLIGAMGQVFDQDDFNMPRVQEGLRSWPGTADGCTLGRYQELRIRFFHQVLMRKLAMP